MCWRQLVVQLLLQFWLGGEPCTEQCHCNVLLKKKDDFTCFVSLSFEHLAQLYGRFSVYVCRTICTGNNNDHRISLLTKTCAALLNLGLSPRTWDCHSPPTTPLKLLPVNEKMDKTGSGAAMVAWCVGEGYTKAQTHGKCCLMARFLNKTAFVLYEYWWLLLKLFADLFWESKGVIFWC